MIITKKENEMMQVLPIMEKTDKSNSPDYVKLLNKLGFIYEERCEYAQAEKFYLLSVKAMHKIGDEGRNIQRLRIKTICNLGRILYIQRKYTKAEHVFFKAFVIAEQTFGPAHIEFARVLKYFGLLYEKIGCKSEAEQFYHRGLLIIESQIGSKQVENAA
jgi:tetratricopeptide (TPR) repeat protein